MTDDEIIAIIRGRQIPHIQICALANAALEARAELATVTKDRDEAIRCALMRRDRLDKAEADLAASRAELATVTAERDAARESLMRAGIALHIAKRENADLQSAAPEKEQSDE